MCKLRLRIRNLTLTHIVYILLPSVTIEVSIGRAGVRAMFVLRTACRRSASPNEGLHVEARRGCTGGDDLTEIAEHSAGGDRRSAVQRRVAGGRAAMTARNWSTSGAIAASALLVRVLTSTRRVRRRQRGQIAGTRKADRELKRHGVTDRTERHSYRLTFGRAAVAQLLLVFER